MEKEVLYNLGELFKKYLCKILFFLFVLFFSLYYIYTLKIKNNLLNKNNKLQYEINKYRIAEKEIQNIILEYNIITTKEKKKLDEKINNLANLNDSIKAIQLRILYKK